MSAASRSWIFGGALFALAAVHCGSSNDAPPDPTSDGTSAPAAPGPGSADADGGAAAPDAAPPACRSAARVAAIAACIDAGGGPQACLSKTRMSGDPVCDADQDGLDDALEDAMLKSYAPVFAFNKGDGSHASGDSEPIYPTNAKQYVAHSTLYWRVDGDDSTKKVVLPKPTLDLLAGAKVTVDGTERHASDPALGQGANFWLCLNQVDGSYPSDALVGSMEESRQLDDGIDVFSVAHPSSSDPSGRYVVLEYMLFYAYNQFTLDTHEGDFEGGAVFVDTETGKVVTTYTDRHPTADGTELIPLEGTGTLPAKDPTHEAPHYDVCDDTNSAGTGGVRFWDFATQKHHPVIYPAAGGHASYGYPGATKIKGVGCIEETMIRDVHNGNGPKLVPFENAYYTDWGQTKAPVTHGVNIINLGERQHLAATWSAFVGQWGCTLSTIPKSYPGPWDNDRLCRHWLTNDWGTSLPFAKSSATSCQ